MELPSVGQQKVTDQGVGDWIAWLKDNMGINFNVDNLNWSKLCDEYMLVFFSARYQIDVILIIIDI